jgi:hypothetical protein
LNYYQCPIRFSFLITPVRLMPGSLAARDLLLRMIILSIFQRGSFNSPKIVFNRKITSRSSRLPPIFSGVGALFGFARNLPELYEVAPRISNQKPSRAASWIERQETVLTNKLGNSMRDILGARLDVAWQRGTEN